MRTPAFLVALPDVARGCLWMLITVACFSFMAVSTRELSSDLDTEQILFFRSAIAVLVTAPFLLRRGLSGIASNHKRFHVLRAGIQLTAQACWVIGIALLPLAEVTALEFTIPIWTFLLAVPFLGERVLRHRILAVVLGFVGVLIILRPGIEAVSWPALVVIGGAVCFAASGVLVKFLTRHDSPGVIIFYMNGIQLLLVIGPALWVWKTPALADVPWILIWGLTGLLAHYTMARGLKLADISVLFPLDFLRLPVLAIVGFLFYTEAIDPWTALGALVIFGGNYYSVRKETQMAREERL